MLVTPAIAADAADWLDMRRALWPDGDHADEVRAYFNGTLRNPLAVLIARDAAGAACGFAELSIRNYAEDAETDRVAFLEGWYVVPEARRRGVGAALIGAAEQWARDQGCTEFGSDTVADNVVSIAAHRALGFADAGTVRAFLKRL